TRSYGDWSSDVCSSDLYGAEIVMYDRHTQDREQVAREIVQRTGRVLVPPYDDPAIMAGQGTAALELLEDVPSLDALLTPVGGGGDRKSVVEGKGVQRGG